MTKQGFTGRRTQERPRRFVRVRSEAGECEHRVLVGVGDYVGRCLECGTWVRTPFTIRGSEWLPGRLNGEDGGNGTMSSADKEMLREETLRIEIGPTDAANVSTNQLTMDEVRLPAAVVPALQPCAA